MKSSMGLVLLLLGDLFLLLYLPVGHRGYVLRIIDILVSYLNESCDSAAFFFLFENLGITYLSTLGAYGHEA